MRPGSHTALSNFIVPIDNTYRPDPEDPAVQDLAGYGRSAEEMADILELCAHDIVLRTGKQPDMPRLIEVMHEAIQDGTSAWDRRETARAKKNAEKKRRRKGRT